MLGTLRDKLAKTSHSLRGKLEELLRSGKSRDGIFDELAEILVGADAGIAATEKIILSLKQKTRKDTSFEEIRSALEEELIRILSRHSVDLSVNDAPAVIMIVGVNGGGKTTSLAKLAHYFKKRGKKVLMVAADTFRAAAQEQLMSWGKNLGIPVIRGQYGADPAAVVFDALQSFKAHGYDLLLVDTAGRIHTNPNLMNELEKIRRVIRREVMGAPQEILLVLDATTGQNALVQAREFLRFSGITGIVLTKLDGTAKGGSVIGIVDELQLPVKFIGLGEDIEDFLPFSAHQFVTALTS
ncbi:MAG: signal recognition particle-docking protein FtsY [Clostridiales bacterium]|nr:signal recognition particle-docking protein FtsY [Clostridiales bacterium]